MSSIKIINGDCLKEMGKFNEKVDVILTSPPYNNSKKRGTWSKEQKYHYDVSSIDKFSDVEYIDFSIKLFNNYDNILKKDGVILYNLSYSTGKSFQMYDVIYNIMKNTDFKVADTIVWKKKSALPNNMSKKQNDSYLRVCIRVC
jgi:DNA modification methylase